MFHRCYTVYVCVCGFFFISIVFSLYHLFNWTLPMVCSGCGSKLFDVKLCILLSLWSLTHLYLYTQSALCFFFMIENILLSPSVVVFSTLAGYLLLPGSASFRYGKIRYGFIILYFSFGTLCVSSLLHFLACLTGTGASLVSMLSWETAIPQVDLLCTPYCNKTQMSQKKDQFFSEYHVWHMSNWYHMALVKLIWHSLL